MLEAAGETQARNFEEFWVGRVGKTLYERYNKYYNMKAWFLDDNRKMDFGFEATVKRKPLETGSRYEFHTGWINAYPIAHDGYNKYFDWSTEGCEIILNEVVTHVDFDKRKVILGNGQIFNPDLLVSTISPDALFDCDEGELAYVGREVLRLFFLFLRHYPMMSILSIIQARMKLRQESLNLKSSQTINQKIRS